jgi:hypothetical protein
MTGAQLLDYVQASAALQGLPLDATRAHAVATHLARTAQLAALLEQAALAPEDELAEIYVPASFPAQDPVA